MYFADSTPFLPFDAYERARVLQWLCFEQYSHEPNIAVLASGATTQPRRPAGRRLELQMTSKQEGGHAALRAMDGHLAGRSFVVGECYSIADIAPYAYTHVADEAGVDLAAYLSVVSWLERVAAQEGHVTIDA